MPRRPKIALRVDSSVDQVRRSRTLLVTTTWIPFGDGRLSFQLESTEFSYQGGILILPNDCLILSGVGFSHTLDGNSR
jgi:hypothetical protein